MFVRASEGTFSFVLLYSSHTEEENKLRAFDNRVLREIFGPKRDKMTQYWRRLHNEELHYL
jgi:hypothetical protein